MNRKISFVLLVAALLTALSANLALAAGPVETAAGSVFTGGPKNIKAADLYTVLKDGDASNDPYILDVRAPADFATGHIADAHNVTVQQLFTAAELAKLPKNKQIVVVCYSGQTSSQVTPVLRMLGYDATNLTYGIGSWGSNDKVKYGFAASQSGNYKVTTEAAPALFGTNAAPKPLADTVQAAAAAYFSGGTKNIKAADLFANLNDGDKTNDPIVLDWRSAADYALGHIAGAVNVPAATFFTAENLGKLPAGTQIVSVCYAGHTASQTSAVLRLLGYDAYNMTYGMPAWAIVAGVSSAPFDASKTAGYPLVVGAAAAASATAAPAAAATTAPTAAATSAVPSTLPKTNGSGVFGLLLTAAALAVAGLALRRRVG